MLREEEAVPCPGVVDWLEACCGAGPEYVRNWIETLGAFQGLK